MFHKPTKILNHAKVVFPQGHVAVKTVVIEGAYIKEILDEAPAGMLINKDNVEVIDAAGYYLTPGLIDQQINGAFGCDFNACSLNEAQTALSKLPSQGITSILPTVITNQLMDMVSIVNTLEETIHLSPPDRTRMMGIHLEGPFINPTYRGCHPKAHVIEPNLEDIQVLVSPNVRLATIAPEMDTDSELVHFLFERGIRVCAGHSDATAHQMEKAISRGLRGVSHLFNAMPGLHHRQPGLLSKALSDDRLFVSLIADGIHIDKDMLFLPLRVKQPRSIILISDAMSLAGQPEGSETQFGGETVTHGGNQGARNEHGKLAGSTTLLSECVRNLVNWQIARFEDVIQLATYNPAQFLGFGDRLGQITPGYLADLVLWDANTLEIQATWIDGHQVFSLNRQKTLA